MPGLGKLIEIQTECGIEAGALQPNISVSVERVETWC